MLLVPYSRFKKTNKKLRIKKCYSFISKIQGVLLVSREHSEPMQGFCFGIIAKVLFCWIMKVGRQFVIIAILAFASLLATSCGSCENLSNGTSSSTGKRSIKDTANKKENYVGVELDCAPATFTEGTTTTVTCLGRFPPEKQVPLTAPNEDIDLYRIKDLNRRQTIPECVAICSGDRDNFIVIPVHDETVNGSAVERDAVQLLNNTADDDNVTQSFEVIFKVDAKFLGFSSLRFTWMRTYNVEGG